MSLTSIFLASVPKERSEPLAEPPSEIVLAELARAGREAWPAFALEAVDFITFLGRTLPASAKLSQLRAGDLWLACAYGRGDPEAALALETKYMPRVRGVLSRMGTSPAAVDDILQELRQKLVEMSAPEPEKVGYSGRGDLGGWLCITAVHAAQRSSELRQREQPLTTSDDALLPSQEEDPEMAFLQREYREELLAAFREALASLSSRDRNLLRYHFIDGLTVDKLGVLYGVSRVTAWRWVKEAREALCSRTREYLSRQITLSESGFQRVIGLIESQIRVNLEQMSA